jgi:hypothetical protein
MRWLARDVWDLTNGERYMGDGEREATPRDSTSRVAWGAWRYKEFVRSNDLQILPMRRARQAIGSMRKTDRVYIFMVERTGVLVWKMPARVAGHEFMHELEICTECFPILGLAIMA